MEDLRVNLEQDPKRSLDWGHRGSSEDPMEDYKGNSMVEQCKEDHKGTLEEAHKGKAEGEANS